MLLKTNLHVLFLLDVVVFCCSLYKMILGGKDFDIDTLLTQLELENFVSRREEEKRKKKRRKGEERRRGEEETRKKQQLRSLQLE